MKLTTLTERIEKAEATIAKKENTIAKKTAYIVKNAKKLEAMGISADAKAFDYRNNDEAYNLLYNIRWYKEDIERLTKEIEEKKSSLEKYYKQKSGELEKENIYKLEIPEVMHKLEAELVEKWDLYDLEKKQRLLKEYHELGYYDFIKKNRYSAYQFIHSTNEEIHKQNEADAKNMVMDLYARVKEITGEVTDWRGIELEYANCGACLNGLVIGKEGRAVVESILAGGYNIQRLHIRVLVKAR